MRGTERDVFDMVDDASRWRRKFGFRHLIVAPREVPTKAQFEEAVEELAKEFGFSPDTAVVVGHVKPTLDQVGPGELVRLKWRNAVRYALSAEWREPSRPTRWLFLLPDKSDPFPICYPRRGMSGYTAILSFGANFTVTYDPLQAPTLPEDGGRQEVGMFISPQGLMLKAATHGQMGPDPSNPLEVLVDTGLVPEGGNYAPLGFISAWDIVLPGQNGGPGTTLVSFPSEAAPLPQPPRRTGRATGQWRCEQRPRSRRVQKSR